MWRRDIDGLWETYRHFVHATAADRDNDADDARAPLEHELSVVADGLKESGGKFFGKVGTHHNLLLQYTCLSQMPIRHFTDILGSTDFITAIFVKQ